jgi:hypothetical protein
VEIQCAPATSGRQIVKQGPHDRGLADAALVGAQVLHAFTDLDQKCRARNGLIVFSQGRSDRGRMLSAQHQGGRLYHSRRRELEIVSRWHAAFWPTRVDDPKHQRSFSSAFGLRLLAHRPAQLDRAGAFSSLCLQIPFYKRAGFPEIYAYVCGSPVKLSIAKSLG